MNILFYRYGSICEPDLLKAFRSFSINVTECTVEISQKHLSSSEKLTFLMPFLAQRHFQFIFSVNYSLSFRKSVNVSTFFTSAGALTVLFWNFFPKPF